MFAKNPDHFEPLRIFMFGEEETTVNEIRFPIESKSNNISHVKHLLFQTIISIENSDIYSKPLKLQTIIINYDRCE